jgi:hypothetical protein
MTLVLSASLDPESRCVTVKSGRKDSNRFSVACNSVARLALSLIQAYIFMIVFNTPAQSADAKVTSSTSVTATSAKKGSRSRTVIGISQTPTLTSSEYNEKMSAKDRDNGARWILIAICGPFNDMNTVMNVVSECKFETKGTRSKVTKLIRLADGIRRNTETSSKPTVYLNTGVKKLEPSLPM